MKRRVMILAALAFALPIAAHAAEVKGEEDSDLSRQYGDKSPAAADSIVEKIAKLQNEIGKGTKVYTPEEMTRLEHKLDDYQLLADTLFNN